jgi:hypothetical protein
LNKTAGWRCSRIDCSISAYPILQLMKFGSTYPQRLSPAITDCNFEPFASDNRPSMGSMKKSSRTKSIPLPPLPLHAAWVEIRVNPCLFLYCRSSEWRHSLNSIFFIKGHSRCSYWGWSTQSYEQPHHRNNLGRTTFSCPPRSRCSSKVKASRIAIYWQSRPIRNVLKSFS